MRELTLYEEICKVDLCNRGLRSQYPYTIREGMTFTQHEMVLNYRQNYCKDIVVLEEPAPLSGGGEDREPPEIQYSFLTTDPMDGPRPPKSAVQN